MVILVLFLILEECFQISTVEYDVSWGFIIYDLYYVELSYAHCLESFYYKCMLNFIQSFFCIYWDHPIILFFNLLMWCITLIYLLVFKNPCTPGINPTCSSFFGHGFLIILLICCCIWLANILLENFASIFASDKGLWYYPFVCVLSLVWLPGWWCPHRVSWEGFLPLQFFCNCFQSLGINSSLNVWWNSPVKPSGPELLLLGSF